MILRLAAAIAIMSLTSACVITPEIEIAETMEFNYDAPAQQPVGYADLLCCFDCTV